MPSLDSIIDRHKEDPAILCGRDGVKFGGMSRLAGTGIVNTSPKQAVACRLCQAEISKGQSCFAWISFIERPAWTKRNPPTGRSPMLSSGVRWFVHHECFLGRLENLAAATAVGVGKFCNACNGAADDLIYVRKRSGLMRVCEGCAERYPITCTYCTHRVEATEASATLTPFTRNVKFDRDIEEERHGVVCDGCAHNYNLDTVNTRRTAHRASRREWATIRAAADDVIGWSDEP